MATVFAARQKGPGGVGRLVAVKLIAPGLSQDASFEKMFLREARIAARLEHPNIVRVYDVREVSGEMLLTMEFVHGATLASLRERAGGPTPPGVAVRIARDVARGLHAAHEAKDQEGQPLGLVHQDISPQNVMVGYDGCSKLLDFGVARLAAEDASRTDTVRGKPSYLTPEQLAGERLDRRTDVFALGIVLYEMLTGDRLFRRATLAETHLAVAQHQGLDRSAIRTPMSPAILGVLERALRRAQEDRFESADALRRALESAAEASGIAVAEDAEVSAWARATSPPVVDPVALEREIADWEAAEVGSIADLPTEPPASRPLGTSTGTAVTRTHAVPDGTQKGRVPFSAVAVGALLVGALSAYFGFPGSGDRSRPSSSPPPPPPVISTPVVPTGPLRCTVGAPLEPMKLPRRVTRLTVAAHDERVLVAAVAGKEARYSIGTVGARARVPLTGPLVDTTPVAGELGLALAKPEGFLLVHQRTHGPGHKPPPVGSVIFQDIDRKDGRPEAGTATMALIPSENAGATSRPLTVYVAGGRYAKEMSSVTRRAHMTVFGPHMPLRTMEIGSYQVVAPLAPAVGIGTKRGAVLLREHGQILAYWFDITSATPAARAVVSVGLHGAPAVAFVGDTAVTLWSERSGEKGPSRLVGSVVRPQDGAWSTRRRLGDAPVSTAAPSIAVSDTRLYVAWMGAESDGPRVHLGASRLERDERGDPKESAPIDLQDAHASAVLVGEGPADFVQIATSSQHTWLAWSHDDVVETALVDCQ